MAMHRGACITRCMAIDHFNSVVNPWDGSRLEGHNGHLEAPPPVTTGGRSPLLTKETGGHITRGGAPDPIARWCPRFHSHTPPQKRPIEHPMAVAVPIPTPPPHIGSVRALLLRHSPPNSVSRISGREFFNSICNSENTQFLEDSVSQVLGHRISAQALVNTAFRDAGSLKGNG